MSSAAPIRGEAVAEEIAAESADAPAESAEAKEDGNAEAQKAMKDRFIVLCRHGIAEDRTPEKDDFDRSLTEEGHRLMKQIGKGFAELMPKLEVIYTSPLLRAIQTALWISKAYEEPRIVKTTNALTPAASFDDFQQLLRDVPERRIVFVGHEPALTRNCLGLVRMKSSGDAELRKGGCYGIRIPSKGDPELEWLLTPKILRALR